MLPRLPRALPAWPDLLADFGNPSAATLARWLDVTPRTVHRWAAAGAAPRAVMLALWWPSSWARDDAQARADYALLLARQQITALQHESRGMAATIERLAPLARAGAANEPLRPDWGPPMADRQGAHRGP